MSFFSGFKRRVQNLLSNANLPLRNLAERQLVLQALSHARTNRGMGHIEALSVVEFCAFSQWGEDGIIDWLVERLPGIPPTFVEFGVENYFESNTRLLLQLRNWRGLVMDGSISHIDDIRRQNVSWRHELSAKCAFIDRDNVDSLLTEAGFGGEIGLLSVDIDGNDYWVWEAIKATSPVIVVCEYNAVFGDLLSLTVPYKADFQRTRVHHSNLYFGASLRAMISLAKKKGYTFFGTASTGCNAFFVRNDHAPVISSAIENIWAYPSNVREARGADGSLLFTSGVARGDIIASLPLVNLETNDVTTLAECRDIYSVEWRRSKKVGF
ncbi:hypothetical protein [Polaromonas sp.]|uniref:hypothetical protein n=1 Tax=Polaromonas sp. TaxID=1869339 RepID=UPI003262E724